MNPSYPHRAIVGDRRLGDRIRRSAREWSKAELGTLTAAQPTVAHGTKTFALYVSGGVVIDTLGVTPVVDVQMMPWNDGAGRVLFFQWNGTLMTIADATGTELPNAEDISAVVDQPYLVIGGASSGLGVGVSTAPGWRCVGGAYLMAAELEVSDDIAVSTTNYWDVGLRRVRGDSALSPPTGDGETVVDFSTSTRLLEGGTPKRIYTNERGLVLGNNDRLIVHAEATGSPPPLRDAVLWLYHRRLAG